MEKEQLIKEIRKRYVDKDEEKLLKVITAIREGKIPVEKLIIIEGMLQNL